MFQRTLAAKGSIAAIGFIVLAMTLTAVTGPAYATDLLRAGAKVQVTVGQSVVLQMENEVQTVSIADPKVADAAVGSAKTVVVNGKALGTTSLVVWEEGGRHTLYTVSTIDPNVSTQVLLKVKVAELNEQRLKEFGVDWIGSWSSSKTLDGTISGGLFITKVETPHNPLLLGPTTDGFATYNRTGGSVSFMSTLRAMEEQGAARTLASPNLVALSGDSATFLAGGEFPVPIARSTTETGITVTIEWKEFGVKLAFVPTVLDSNRIRLYVAPEVSAPDNSRAVLLSGYVVPGLITRKIATTVEMGNGDVLVIGGLKQTETNRTVKKFPVLGDIPVLNLLFKHTKTEKLTRNLVVAVSPEMVRGMMRSFPTEPLGE